MTRNPPDKRSTTRVPVQETVSIRSGQNAVSEGVTRDLSRNGVFFYTEGEIHEGSRLELVLMLPPELTQGAKQWVCCQASVVRVEGQGKGGKIGVAAKVESIAALPEIPL